MPFARAELLMEDWMYNTAISLTTESDLLVLALNDDAVPIQSEGQFGYWSAYRLYVEAEGYAAIESEPMSLIGTPGWTSEEEPATEVVVKFPNNPPLTVQAGETGEMDLILRKPRARTLRFVDDDRAPVQGVEVTSYMYETGANRCGSPWGRFLAEGISDKAGRVAIPDGDWEYILWFDKPGYHRQEFQGYYTLWGPMELVTYLSSEETVIPLHRLRKQPLRMLFRSNGVPLANEPVYGQWIGCRCSLCEELLATTDEAGRIEMDEFYPEEWAFLFVFGQDGFDWESDGDPKEFPAGEVIEVELYPRATPIPMPTRTPLPDGYGCAGYVDCEGLDDR